MNKSHYQSILDLDPIIELFRALSIEETNFSIDRKMKGNWGKEYAKFKSTHSKSIFCIGEDFQYYNSDDSGQGEPVVELYVLFKVSPRVNKHVSDIVKYALFNIIPSATEQFYPNSREQYIDFGVPVVLEPRDDECLSSGIHLSIRFESFQNLMNKANYEALREFVNSVYTVQGAIEAAKSKSKSVRTEGLLGWLGEYFVLNEKNYIGCDFSPDWFAPYDLKLNLRFLEVKTSTDDTLPMHFSSAEIVFGISEGNSYEVIRVIVEKQLLEDSLILITSELSPTDIDNVAYSVLDRKAILRLSAATGIAPQIVEKKFHGIKNLLYGSDWARISATKLNAFEWIGLNGPKIAKLEIFEFQKTRNHF